MRAVMFDLDGTLLDTIEDLEDSMNAVLASLGLPPHDTAAYRRFVGDGVAKLIERALPADRRDPEWVARLIPLMREEYGRRYDVKSRPYEGIPDLLAGLAARGVPATVLSNKPDELTRLCIEKLLPGFDFAVVRGARPDIPRKPDPTAALEIADEMEIAPGEFLYLGDTNTDMRTAVAAGMVAVGALWGFREGAELTASGAKRLIEKPTDLLELL